MIRSCHLLSSPHGSSHRSPPPSASRPSLAAPQSSLILLMVFCKELEVCPASSASHFSPRRLCFPSRFLRTYFSLFFLWPFISSLLLFSALFPSPPLFSLQFLTPQFRIPASRRFFHSSLISLLFFPSSLLSSLVSSFLFSPLLVYIHFPPLLFTYTPL